MFNKYVAKIKIFERKTNNLKENLTIKFQKQSVCVHSSVYRMTLFLI